MKCTLAPFLTSLMNELYKTSPNTNPPTAPIQKNPNLFINTVKIPRMIPQTALTAKAVIKIESLESDVIRNSIKKIYFIL